MFTCTATYGSRFGVNASRISDAATIYSKGYYINNPVTGQPYNPKAVTQSLDIDRDGNLFVAGRSCQDLAVGGIIGVVKVRASDGMEIWNKIVDITPGDKDELSNARVVYARQQQNAGCRHRTCGAQACPLWF